MARRISVKNEAILEAARRIFLRDGLQAPTARIAREVGISEALIFKRFQTKANLFCSAMQMQTQQQTWHKQLMQSVGTKDIRKSLETAGQQLLRHLQTVIPRIVMIRSSGITIANNHHFPAQPTPAIKILTAYFKAESQQGRLVFDAPEALAHVFFGALSHYAFYEMMTRYRPISSAAYVRVVVGTILRAARLPLPKPRAKQTAGAASLATGPRRKKKLSSPKGTS